MEGDISEKSLLEFFESLWLSFSEKCYPVQVPDFWNHILDVAKICLTDQDYQDISLFDKLEQTLRKIIKCWKNNFKRWPVDTFDQLYGKTSQLLAASYQTSLPSEVLKKIEDCVDGLLAADPPTLEDFSSGSTKETTTMLPTTAHGATDRADASGSKKR